MNANLAVTSLTLLGLLQLSQPLSAGQSLWPQGLAVQSGTKADSRLLVEIPQMVVTWTDKCTHIEKARSTEAPRCWREAAAAIDDYESGFDGPLIEQLHRLHSAWLVRVAQLESSHADRVAKAPPVAIAPATVPKGTPAIEPRPLRKKLQAVKADTPKAVAAQDSVRAVPAKQRKKISAAEEPPQKPDPSAKSREVKVVPAAHVSQVETATRGLSSRRKAEIRAIREELKDIAGRLDCLSRRCITRAN